MLRNINYELLIICRHNFYMVISEDVLGLDTEIRNDLRPADKEIRTDLRPADKEIP